MFISADVLVLGGNIAMAIWGSVVRYMFLLTKREHDAKLLFIGVTTAAFLGLLVFLAAPTISLSTKLSFVLSGILGYTGPDSIDIIRRVILFKKLGLSKDEVQYIENPTTDAEEAGKRG